MKNNNRFTGMLRTIFCALAAAVMFVACDEPYEMDLNQSEPKIVIEALLTNQPGYQYVKVTRTNGFYETGATPRIQDAVVSVTDDGGNVYNYVHNPGGNEDSVGFYLPQTPFTGTVGRVYTLRVEADDEVFEASDKLLAVTTMDSLGYRIDTDEEEDPEDEGKFYELLMYTKEPQDEDNYYLFKFYRNDSLTFEVDSDIYFSDDELLAENIDGVSSPIYYGVGDKGRVEMFSLSRKGFIYYNDLSSLLNNDGGGMFGSVPSSPRTNLTNGALGFFQVSALDISEVVVE